jgi:hypothetical protein
MGMHNSLRLQLEQATFKLCGLIAVGVEPDMCAVELRPEVSMGWAGTILSMGESNIVGAVIELSEISLTNVNRFSALKCHSTT